MAFSGSVALIRHSLGPDAVDAAVRYLSGAMCKLLIDAGAAVGPLSDAAALPLCTARMAVAEAEIATLGENGALTADGAAAELLSETVSQLTLLSQELKDMKSKG